MSADNWTDIFPDIFFLAYSLVTGAINIFLPVSAPIIAADTAG